MIQKPIDKITKDDIHSLIENKVREGRIIDYKASLPGKADKDKTEFLADVSSFANASGGDLVYGVSESKEIPDKATGLPGISDVGKERRRLQSLILDCIEPRIPGVQIQPIDGFAEGPVLVIRVPKSWRPPHMVAFGGRSRFYVRNNAGKHQMDVTEIRSAFALSEALPERIRRFRDDRLAKVVADETPVRLDANPKFVLHIIPLVSFSHDFWLAPAMLKSQWNKLVPIKGSSCMRYNVDGIITHPDDADPKTGTYQDYCQTFREGRIEAVDAHMLRTGKKVIPGVNYERHLIEAVQNYLQALRDMEVPPPVVVMLSMLGVAGYRMAFHPKPVLLEEPSIDRDTLLLPDVLVEGYDEDVGRVLRPIFDAVWNATGWEGSRNYDSDGNWTPNA
ncbi:MAG: ATP-binding protein [Phycisphaerae bacterium]|nr:ATP-binding protein [Phycisphaerae bacterium]